MSKRSDIVAVTKETTRRSTRTRIRIESESFSQSFESTRKTRSRRVDGFISGTRPVQDVPRESLQSIDTQTSSGSTAVLPDKFQVLIGCEPGKGPLNVSQAEKVWVQGAEILADARRSGEKEETLKHLRKVVSSRKGGVHVDGVPPDQVGRLEEKLEKDVLWYTAAFEIPYTSDLQSHKHHWSPRKAPPCHLPILDFQPPHLNPLVGSSIPPWSIGPATDIDPLSDDLVDFDNQWQDATDSGWSTISPKQIQEALSLDCDEVEEGHTITNISNTPAPPRNNLSVAVMDSSTLFLPPSPLIDNLKRVGLRGNLAKVGSNVEMEDDSPPLFDLPLKHVQHGFPKVLSNPQAEVSETDWQAEAKQRKAWWRLETAKEGYGEIWSIIPRPHSLPPKSQSSRKTKTPRPPNYILPRFYSLPSSIHPFHPNLNSYITTNPHSRVYWSIPIHGPIHIPTYFDHLSTPPSKAPIPSSADLKAATGLSHPTSRVITWTAGLLTHFWSDFLLPLHQNPETLGTISITLSGPKPDPYLSLRSSKPLPPWSPIQADSTMPSPLNTKIDPDLKLSPVRPEMGDHIRIYCPLKSALSLRTWLHAIEVDSSFVEGSSAPQGDQSKPLVRLFDKVRFVLVGDRGEALIVA